MPAQIDELIAQVNAILAREVTITETVAFTDPLTGHVRRQPKVRAAAQVWPPGPHNPPAVETPWGFFLPIARVEVGPQQATCTYHDIRKATDPLRVQLGVPVAFEMRPGGGGLDLWVPKVAPNPSYFLDAYNSATLGPLAGVVGVDRWNRPVVVDLNQGADRHVVILGPTTAGKSIIADMFLLSMCLRTGPDILRLAIFDCKNKAHEPWRDLPHMALYAGGGERNRDGILAGIAALDRLVDERQHSGVSNPVIVALFDDGREPEAWTPDYKKTMGRLLRLGASAGIRIVITAHELKEDWAGDASRSNLNTRIVSSNDVTKTAAQVGRGGSGAHNVDQALRQFVLMQNNQVQTFYAPHVCQPGRFLDLNRNGRDDVLDAIAECQIRHRAQPFEELAQALPAPPAATVRPALAIAAKPVRTVGGVTYDKAVEIAVALIEQNPAAKKADLAQGLWGERVYSGDVKVRFLNDVLAEAREKVG